MSPRLLLVLFFCIAPLRGEVVIVKTEILAVSLDAPVEGLFIDTGNGIQPFSANLAGLGLPMPYQGPRRLVLHKSEEAFKSEPGQQPPTPAAVVELPAVSDRAILVCTHTPGGALRLVAYDISTGGMKPGGYRFFNYSKLPVSFIVGERKFSLSPGTDNLVSDSKWQTEVMDLEVQFGLRASANEPFKRVYASVWGHRPIRRNYVFLFDGNSPSKPITSRRFFDILPAITTAR